MPEEKAPKGEKRPYVSILFECCMVYSRAYRNKAGTHYVGWCPRCARKIELKIGPGGTDNRIFRAG